MIPSVYRCYGAEGALLYIGMTGDVTRRMIQHRCNSPWGRSVVRIEVTIHQSREEAFRVEAEEITLRSPKWNGLTVETQRPRKKRQPFDMAASSFGRALIEAGGNMTATAWAERFGVSRPYLYSLLDGSRQPSLDVAIRIASATNGAVPLTSWPKLAKIVRAGRDEIGPPHQGKAPKKRGAA